MDSSEACCGVVRTAPYFVKKLLLLFMRFLINAIRTKTLSKDERGVDFEHAGQLKITKTLIMNPLLHFVQLFCVK